MGATRVVVGRMSYGDYGEMMRGWELENRLMYPRLEIFKSRKVFH
jgi:hypothetical protein